MATAIEKTMRTGVNMAAAQIAHDRSGWSLLADQGPVFQDTKGMYCVTTRQGCQFVLQHPEIFSSAKAFGFEQTPFTLIPIAVDPPKHAEYRRAIGELFSPRAVNGLEPVIRQQCVELIEAFADKGHCDINTELARLFPTQVFLTIFGLPLEDRDRCAEWVATCNGGEIDFTASHGDGASAVQEASANMTNFLAAAIERKRATPADDIFGRIVSLTGADAWTDDELLGFGWIMLLAGLDTVASAIGFVFNRLATDSDLRHQTIENPAMIDRVVEEVLRLETVAPWVPRFTNEDVEVEGYTIPANSFVAPLIAVANRDPSFYGDANLLDIAQNDRGHFAFGGGTHRCVGSHLARLELRIIVEEFHRLIPEYSLAPGTEPTVNWPSGTINFETLPVVFPVKEC